MSKLAVDLVCDIYSPSGYSTHAREVIRALHPLCDLRIVDHKHDRMSVQMDDIETALFKSLQDKDRPAQVRVQFETPEFFEPVPGVVNLGFTQWETTRIPDTDYKGNERNNWVKQMNRMAGMLTTSTTAADAFVKTGVKVPVKVFYGPVDTNLHRPDMPELPIDDLVYDRNGTFVPREKRPLTVGMVAQWTLRKNIEDFLITMFSRFKQGEVHIILKTYGSVMDDQQTKLIEQRVKEVAGWVKCETAPKVSLITEKLTDQEIAQLYGSMDVYVSTSRGEGLCMPVVQAMATGCIPVVCGFSAPGEYVDKSFGFSLPYQLKPAVGMTWSPWYRADQNWADVDCQALEESIRGIMLLREKHPNLYKQMGKLAREHTVKHMSHQVAGRRMLTCIEELASQPCAT